MTKTIQIGGWDEDKRQVVVNDNATLSEALRIAGIRPTRTQQITAFSDAAAIDEGELVRDGETYLLTGNQVNGQ